MKALILALTLACAGVASVATIPKSGRQQSSFEGRHYRGRGDTAYLRLLETARRMFDPDPEYQNLSMLYTPSWDGFVEGPTWDAWWIQNSYGTSYCAMPFLQEPYATFLRNANDLWFSQMGDGKRKGAEPPLDWVAPDGCLCDAARPGWIVYRQGDGRIQIHDWAMEFTAAGILLQTELLLIDRDPKETAHYIPLLERSANFLETRRDPKNNLYLAGPAGNLLAPSYAGYKKPDGTYGMAYLTGLSVTTIAALDRLIEVEKLAGRTEQARLYARRRELSRKGLAALTTPEGYLIRSLDPDGAKHGVFGAPRHGYFETSPNHDAVCFRVAGDAQAKRIMDRMAAIPQLRPFDFILPNYPSYDDMYEEPKGLWEYGTWVNGGHWSTCEARMVMANYRTGRYEDARRSMERLLTFARRFRMDNPLTKRGSDVYQPKQPVNITYDAFGPAAAMLRGLFEYLYRADALTIVPHIPPGITEMEQRDPVRFGSKRLYLATRGRGLITGVRINGKAWRQYNASQITLPYDRIPDDARIVIALGGADPAMWRTVSELPRPAVSIPAQSKDKEEATLLAHRRTLAAFLKRTGAGANGSTYEAAHARLALDAIDTAFQRQALRKSGLLAPLPPESQAAADHSYVEAAERLYAGLDTRMKAAEKYSDQPGSRYASLWRDAANEAESDPAQAPLKDSDQDQERTCFQTGGPYSPGADLRADVAICYGIDPKLPERIESWRKRGYRIHVMTGVSWGHYQDYLYGRFDGVNHVDEAQTDRNGNKISHGGDVYYMCPGENFGKFLSVGVKRALDAGAEAIHLEEPEFWVRGGYSEGFKREWRKYYHEEWIPPHTSPDASWRASKLKYYLYRRALQQVFSFVQDYNRLNHRHVRCYVPTHSLLNYSHWRIVSPESSLARLKGCDGYIAQVWTGTSRTPNVYRGVTKERTFETAFLEYGAMQNLVRATGRRVWYLHDPVEDDPNHDWADYRTNWFSTVVASLLHPEVWRYEISPWPERVFSGRYPDPADRRQRVGIPPSYAKELQQVMNALTDMNQSRIAWDCGTQGVGVVVSDSLMFERGDAASSDEHMSHFYALALPLVKRGIPVQPVQLENVTISGYLKDFKLLLMTYQGMKPLTPEVHTALAAWVKAGGRLVFLDDDTDPYNTVREWWNTGKSHFATPRQHLFAQLGIAGNAGAGTYRVGKGAAIFVKRNPCQLAYSQTGDAELVAWLKSALAGSGTAWKETNYLLLRRGKYLVGAGLDESIGGAPRVLRGNFMRVTDPQLAYTDRVELRPGVRVLLLDLDSVPKDRPSVLIAGCRAVMRPSMPGVFRCSLEGIANTTGTIAIRLPRKPRSVEMQGATDQLYQYDAAHGILRLSFPNEPWSREMTVRY